MIKYKIFSLKTKKEIMNVSRKIKNLFNMIRYDISKNVLFVIETIKKTILKLFLMLKLVIIQEILNEQFLFH